MDRVVNSKISENIENRNKEGDQDNLNRVNLIILGRPGFPLNLLSRVESVSRSEL